MTAPTELDTLELVCVSVLCFDFFGIRSVLSFRASIFSPHCKTFVTAKQLHTMISIALVTVATGQSPQGCCFGKTKVQIGDLQIAVLLIQLTGSPSPTPTLVSLQEINRQPSSRLVSMTPSAFSFPTLTLTLTLSLHVDERQQ